MFLAGGSVLLAGAATGLVASRPSMRGQLDVAAGRVSASIARRTQAAAGPPPARVTISVDRSKTLRPISPLIYGVAHADADQLVTLGAQLNRWGGNPNTRYNWIAEAWNAARDWEFRNYGGDSSGPTPPGSASDAFVATNRSLSVESQLTVPTMGWVARNRDKAVASVGVPADGGPPLAAGTDAIAAYDPTDNRRKTSVPSLPRKGAPFVDAPTPGDGPAFQDEWVNHLVNRFGRADDGGVRYYVMDNEPDLWSFTHTDVHPVQTSYEDVLANFLEYATAIKAVDPSAKIMGPALSGWTGYFYSALDRGPDAYRTHRDRQAHGDMPFLAWWLEQVRKHDERLGSRTLDVLDVHYYPQGAGVFMGYDDPWTRGLRLRSTRALWDPSYVDESWIADTVRLIPRMREWIDQYYPGTPLAIGEWNWGAEKTMSGALAVADVLGIFGREGVDMAAYWTFPPLDSPAAQAFQLYTHYNAQGDAFGDRALAASVDASPDYVTTYASLDSSSNDIVVVAINKRFDADISATLRLNGVGTARAEMYRYTDGDTVIQSVGLAQVDGGMVDVTLPAASATLVRIRRI